MRLFRLCTAVAVLLALAVPASADHGEVHPTFRGERVYFHCADQVKVQNAAYAQKKVPSWNTTAPAQSFTAGAGCGYYENAVGGWLGANETTLDSAWEGTFSGNVDSITVELHNLGVTASRATRSHEMRFSLFIDGKQVNTDRDGVTVTPVTSSTRASERVSFTIAGIGLNAEGGDGTLSRRFRLVARSLSEQQSAWVWDATEVPAGLTFNPATPEPVVVSIR